MYKCCLLVGYISGLFLFSDFKGFLGFDTTIENSDVFLEDPIGVQKLERSPSITPRPPRTIERMNSWNLPKRHSLLWGYTRSSPSPVAKQYEETNVSNRNDSGADSSNNGVREERVETDTSKTANRDHKETISESENGGDSIPCIADDNSMVTSHRREAIRDKTGTPKTLLSNRKYSEKNNNTLGTVSESDSALFERADIADSPMKNPESQVSIERQVSKKGGHAVANMGMRYLTRNEKGINFSNAKTVVGNSISDPVKMTDNIDYVPDETDAYCNGGSNDTGLHSKSDRLEDGRQSRTRNTEPPVPYISKAEMEEQPLVASSPDTSLAGSINRQADKDGVYCYDCAGCGTGLRRRSISSEDLSTLHVLQSFIERKEMGISHDVSEYLVHSQKKSIYSGSLSFLSELQDVDKVGNNGVEEDSLKLTFGSENNVGPGCETKDVVESRMSEDIDMDIEPGSLNLNRRKSFSSGDLSALQDFSKLFGELDQRANRGCVKEDFLVNDFAILPEEDYVTEIQREHNVDSIVDKTNNDHFLDQIPPEIEDRSNRTGYTYCSQKQSLPRRNTTQDLSHCREADGNIDDKPQKQYGIYKVGSGSTHNSVDMFSVGSDVSSVDEQEKLNPDLETLQWDSWLHANQTQQVTRDGDSASVETETDCDTSVSEESVTEKLSVSESIGSSHGGYPRNTSMNGDEEEPTTDSTNSSLMTTYVNEYLNDISEKKCKRSVPKTTPDLELRHILDYDLDSFNTVNNQRRPMDRTICLLRREMSKSATRMTRAGNIGEASLRRSASETRLPVDGIKPRDPVEKPVPPRVNIRFNMNSQRQRIEHLPKPPKKDNRAFSKLSNHHHSSNKLNDCVINGYHITKEPLQRKDKIVVRTENEKTQHLHHVPAEPAERMRHASLPHESVDTKKHQAKRYLSIVNIADGTNTTLCSLDSNCKKRWSLARSVMATTCTKVGSNKSTGYSSFSRRLQNDQMSFNEPVTRKSSSENQSVISNHHKSLINLELPVDSKVRPKLKRISPLTSMLLTYKSLGSKIK